jgi:glycosyltransferase involved in cell wall biosynthesis
MKKLDGRRIRTVCDFICPNEKDDLIDAYQSQSGSTPQHLPVELPEQPPLRWSGRLPEKPEPGTDGYRPPCRRRIRSAGPHAGCGHPRPPARLPGPLQSGRPVPGPHPERIVGSGQYHGVGGVSTMGFPEPFTFGIRAQRFLRNRMQHYDIVHDNQSLSYGIWSIAKKIPTVATIHHPITVDRDIAVRSVRPFWKKLKHLRWFSFIGMQKRVSRTLRRVITVSECAREDIARDFRIPRERFSVVPNGINTRLFYPIADIRREPGRIIVTNSSDVPLKGLYYLLHAVAEIAKKRLIRLVVVGTPKKKRRHHPADPASGYRRPDYLYRPHQRRRICPPVCPGRHGRGLIRLRGIRTAGR